MLFWAGILKITRRRQKEAIRESTHYDTNRLVYRIFNIGELEPLTYLKYTTKIFSLSSSRSFTSIITLSKDSKLTEAT